MKGSWALVILVVSCFCVCQSSNLRSLHDDSYNKLENNVTMADMSSIKEFLAEAFQWRDGGYQVENKKEWPPLEINSRTIAASVLTFGAASLSSAGGIGGGGLFLSILSLVMEYDSRASAAISAFMVMSVSIVSLIFYFPMKHPTQKSKSIIDYDLALLLQPNMLLGISLGVICNIMFPEWLILLLLAVCLSYITFTSCRSSFRAWNVESAAANARSSKSEINVAGSSERMDDKTLQEPLIDDQKVACSIVPLKELGILVLIWATFYFINVSQDKNFFKLQHCGIAYWLFSGLQVPLAIAITIWMMFFHKRSSGSFIEQQAQGGSVYMFPVLGLFAGILGGMLGIGGGMLINPFLIKSGMQAKVTAATCAFMVFFSASMSGAEFLLLGVVPPYHAAYFSAICFFGSLFGLVAINHAIAKYDRLSLMIFSVCLVMTITTVLTVTFGSLKMWGEYMDGKYMGFKAPC